VAHLALVTPYLPAPDNTGGRIRMHRLARSLAAVASVDLFARVFPVELTADIGPALADYHSVYLRGADLGAWRLCRESRRVREASPFRLALDLRAAHARRPYDAVIACHCYAAATARSLGTGVPLVVDEHNIESRYARRMSPGDADEHALMERWERAQWRDASLVTAVTERDAEAIREHRGGPTLVVANGADASRVTYRAPSQRASRSLLFIGAMSHPPNVAAAVRLAREVLPRVREAHPDATLVLCGRAPDATVRSLASEHVTVTGTVPDTRPFLDAAGCYVNALSDGEGSSLKLPEAMASGVPVVSTAVGARGFDVAHGRELLLTADDSMALASGALSCFADPRAADARAALARAFAEGLDWTLLGDRFARAVLGILR
jgi:glycosyltransferase involved in cell wall biosynthesis